MADINVPDLRVVGEYLATLGGRSASMVDAYGRILRSLAGWVAERPGGARAPNKGFILARDLPPFPPAARMLPDPTPLSVACEYAFTLPRWLPRKSPILARVSWVVSVKRLPGAAHHQPKAA